MKRLAKIGRADPPGIEWYLKLLATHTDAAILNMQSNIKIDVGADITRYLILKDGDTESILPNKRQKQRRLFPFF